MSLFDHAVAEEAPSSGRARCRRLRASPAASRGTAPLLRVVDADAAPCRRACAGSSLWCESDVVRLGDADLRIGQLAGLARGVEGGDARDVRLVGERHQVEHQRQVFVVRLRDADRRLRRGELDRALLLGLLDPPLDLADVLSGTRSAAAGRRRRRGPAAGRSRGRRNRECCVLPAQPRRALGRRAGPRRTSARTPRAG